MKTNAVPDEIAPAGFEAQLLTCTEPHREVVAYVRTAAQHAGVAVMARRFRHPTPNSGWGVTYYVGSFPFCEIHPKVKAGHVWVRLRGVDQTEVVNAGFEPSQQQGWVKIRNIAEAVRIVPWILRAHDAHNP
jgi:hypothetical protein